VGVAKRTVAIYRDRTFNQRPEGIEDMHEHPHDAHRRPRPYDVFERFERFEREAGRGGRRGDHDHGDDHPFGGPFGGGFGPGGRGGGRMRRGQVRFALLIALLDGPSHGYDLIQRLEEKAGGRWRPSPGSVYPALQLLDDEGLVTSRREDDKQIFELTDAGRAQATEHVERFGNPWERFGDGGDHGKLRIALRDLQMAARQVGVTGSPESITQAVEIVTRARKELYRLLADA
jgi:DNA-binding PadR family transcriptional regulator